MQKFTVTLTRAVEADSAEEAALLTYQELTSAFPPLTFSVADAAGAITEVKLDGGKADEFAAEDHTADPGNW